MSRPIEDSTVRSGGDSPGAAKARTATVTAVTVIWHPDLDRIGEVCPLPDLLATGPQVVSRLTPLFGPPGLEPRRALEDSRLSRTASALVIGKNVRGLLELHPGAGEPIADVDGVALTQPHTVMPAELDRGVVVLLARRIVLCLHRTVVPIERGPSLGLVGGSERMERIRKLIRRVARTDVPVLIRGHTGTGKELVARALVEGSSRAEKPFVAINMAAIPPGTAAAELFGYERGAFTGAATARRGYFGEAAGGTLFLDEVGLTPSDLQPMLLRVLETGEVWPLGGSRPRPANVRVIAATDADLEAAIASRSFSEPLFHRLAGFHISLPALRQRREDFGSLLLHFLKCEMPDLKAGLFREGSHRPFLSATQVAQLAAGSWPGNVRALRNAVRQIVIAGRDEPEALIDEEIERLMDGLPRTPLVSNDASDRVVSAAATGDRVKAAEIEPDTFLDALRRNRWSPSATAAALNLPRTTVHALMDRHPAVRKPASISAAELRREMRECGGDVTAMAERLRVSVRGLRLRLSQVFQDGTQHSSWGMQAARSTRGPADD